MPLKIWTVSCVDVFFLSCFGKKMDDRQVTFRDGYGSNIQINKQLDSAHLLTANEQNASLAPPSGAQHCVAIPPTVCKSVRTVMTSTNGGCVSVSLADRTGKLSTMPDSPADVKTQSRLTPPTMPPPPSTQGAPRNSSYTPTTREFCCCFHC